MNIFKSSPPLSRASSSPALISSNVQSPTTPRMGGSCHKQQQQQQQQQHLARPKSVHLISPPKTQPAPVPTNEVALKKEWDIATQSWIESMIVVRLEPKPFAEGALRYAYRMWDVTDEGHSPIALVAKMCKNPSATLDRYVSDVKMQMVAKDWANKFNAMGVPKKVDFLAAYIVQLVSRPGKPVCAVEQYVEGKYERYNNNWDWSDEKRSTPQSFSHFTYVASNQELLICDLQGVGDLWTDPQIHTRDGAGFGQGNKSLQGFARFFSAHSCNAICSFLNLPLVSGSRRPKPAFAGTPPPSWFLAQIAAAREEEEQLGETEFSRKMSASSIPENSLSENSSDETQKMIRSSIDEHGLEEEDYRRGSLFESVLKWESDQQEEVSDYLKRQKAFDFSDSESGSDSDSVVGSAHKENKAKNITEDSPIEDEDLRRFRNAVLAEERAPKHTAAVPALAGSLGPLIGVGIRLEGSSKTGYVIVGLAADSAAARCGHIKVGDSLLAVDDCSLRGLDLDIVKKLVLGPAGSSIFLTVQHKKWGVSSEKRIELVRGGSVGIASAAKKAVSGLLAC